MALPAGLLEHKIDDWAQGVERGTEPLVLLRDWLQLAVHTARADDAGLWLKTGDAEWTHWRLGVASEAGQVSQATASQLPSELQPCLKEQGPVIQRLVQDAVELRQGQSAVRRGGQPAGVLVATWPADLWDSSQHQLGPFLGASAEIFGDLFVQHELRQLRGEHLQSRLLEQFLETLNRQTSVRSLAQLVVHEGRRLTGSERLAIVQRFGWTWRTIAVTGVDTIDPRSDTVQAFEAAARQRLLLASCTDDSKPVIQTALQEVTHSVAAEILPIGGEPEECDGILICEQFGEVRDALEWRRRCQQFQRYLMGPWRAATEREAGLWRHWLGSHRWSRKRLPWIATALVLIAGMAMALSLVPASLVVTAEGALLPAERRDVFAGTSGVVTDVLVRHGDRVGPGQPLVILHDTAGALEYSRVSGELATVTARLNVIQAARISLLTAAPDSALQGQQLAGEEAELKERQAALLGQQSILEDQNARLTVTSPLAGEILTWETLSLLSGRPVERGQVLLTVGDVSGPWVVEARVRERDLPEIAAALSSGEEGTSPKVEVTPSSVPDQKFFGKITDVAKVSDVDDRGEATVRVTIAIDLQGHSVRPGTTVFPRITCGRRALGYVWFREVVHAIRRQWWLSGF